MIPPALLLRDTLVATLVLSGVGLVWGMSAGMENGLAVAAGAFGALVNFTLMVLAVIGAARGGLGAMLLPVKTLIAIAIMGVLLHFFPVLPVLVGFSAGLFGVLTRALVSGVLSPPAQVQPR
jgi:hypothetical protein